MPRMQIVQQKAPPTSWEKAKAPLKIAAIAIVQTIVTIAGFIFSSGIFTIASAIALSFVMSIDLKDRKVIAVTAIAITALIAAVSFAVLFPATAPFMLSLSCIGAGASFIFGFKQECAQVKKAKFLSKSQAAL